MTERTITFDDEEWQLVPRKPTPGMLAKALSCTAAFLHLTGSQATVNFKKMSLRYRAMLASAPCPYERTVDFDVNYECALAERTVTTLLASQANDRQCQHAHEPNAKTVAGLEEAERLSRTARTVE